MMADTSETGIGKNAPDGLVSPQECEGCGAWVETAAGMDHYVEIEEFDTTERDGWVFCDWSCFDSWYQDGRAMGLIPGVPENEKADKEDR